MPGFIRRKPHNRGILIGVKADSAGTDFSGRRWMRRCSGRRATLEYGCHRRFEPKTFPKTDQIMSQASGVGRVPSRWIISPQVDLALIIGAPLAIVPMVLWLVRSHFSEEQISLAVVSFATIGHHLPGFLRAYGDRALFARFRGRFLLVPPMVLAAALAFAWRDFHGLSLVLLMWATWHVLMQTYGFMRIYDLKRGCNNRLDLWLDFALCLTMFSAGMVFSEARILAVVETMWRTGVPITGPEWLVALRWIVGIATFVVLAAYVARQGMLFLQGHSPSPAKLLLVASTGWIYWFTGTLAVDMLVGVAMFEIFHAIQYDTVVWAYNRRLEERSRGILGGVRWLFVDRWSSIAMYVGAILAFGMLRFFSDAITDPLAHKLLFAALAASTLLHFYFDGFIWKVSERTTNVNLDVAVPQQSIDSNSTANWSHAIRWAALAVLLAMLYGLEDRTMRRSGHSEAEYLTALARWIPELPEVQMRMALDALDRGDSQAAVEAAAEAVQHRPNSSRTQASLGLAMLRSERYPEAAEAFAAAARQNPRKWENFADLGAVQSHLQRWDSAEQSFAEAARLAPRQSSVETGWGNLCARRGNPTEAALHHRKALALEPNNAALRASLVESLSHSGDHRTAIEEARHGVAIGSQSSAAHLSLSVALTAAGHFREALQQVDDAIRLEPASSAAQCQRGIVCLALGDADAARKAINTAIALDDKYAPAHFQLGNVRLATGDVDRAVIAYRRSVELAPHFADGYANLGAALQRRQQESAAIDAFETAIRLEPSHGSAHYNLGLALLHRGQTDEARMHIQRARDSGQQPSREVIESLGL